MIMAPNSSNAANAAASCKIVQSIECFCMVLRSGFVGIVPIDVEIGEAALLTLSR